ncbi:MAG: hypothetical protein Q9160_003934 [Pyrenula sp. 1 TL-2023]
MSNQPAPWVDIAQRKCAQQATLIPAEWKLPMTALSNLPSNVMDIPAKSGILTDREVEITEGKRWDGRALVAAIKKGELGVEEVTTAFCKRAALAHQLTSCLTEPLFTPALRRAQHLASLPTSSRSLLPFYGLPMTIKDSFNYSAFDSSIGIAALCFKPSTSSAPLVQLLESLGAIIIAKTNIPQTLSALDSVNNVFGRTLNPLNRALTAGGSSGGEGVVAAMRGSVVGWGTDVGGSIRIPAMCEGVYGIKPSVGRVPFGGQEDGGSDGMTRCGKLQAVAGPIAANLDDAAWALTEVATRSHIWGNDCIPSPTSSWSLSTPATDSSSPVIGILPSDGNAPPLPPISALLSEVTSLLTAHGIQTLPLSTPPSFTKSQSLAVRLMSPDGAPRMNDLLSATGEPLILWLANGPRFGRSRPRTLEEVRQLNIQRSQIENEMNELWYSTSATTTSQTKRRKLDAIICPVAPHPVPEIDHWNAVGYTSTFVLLDWPAGTVPVRRVTEEDLKMELGGEEIGSSWERRNRELWNAPDLDRRVYLDSPLCVQVVTPKLHDAELCRMMKLVADAVAGGRQEGSGGGSVRAKM